MFHEFKYNTDRRGKVVTQCPYGMRDPNGVFIVTELECQRCHHYGHHDGLYITCSNPKGDKKCTTK